MSGRVSIDFYWSFEFLSGLVGGSFLPLTTFFTSSSLMSSSPSGLMAWSIRNSSLALTSDSFSSLNLSISSNFSLTSAFLSSISLRFSNSSQCFLNLRTAFKASIFYS